MLGRGWRHLPAARAPSARCCRPGWRRAPSLWKLTLWVSCAIKEGLLRCSHFCASLWATCTLFPVCSSISLSLTTKLLKGGCCWSASALPAGQLATREFWERPLVKRPPVPPERSLQDVLADLFQEGPPEVHSQLQHFFPRTAPQDSLLSRSATLCLPPCKTPRQSS